MSVINACNNGIKSALKGFYKPQIQNRIDTHIADIHHDMVYEPPFHEPPTRGTFRDTYTRQKKFCTSTCLIEYLYQYPTYMKNTYATFKNKQILTIRRKQI